MIVSVKFLFRFHEISMVMVCIIHKISMQRLVKKYVHFVFNLHPRHINITDQKVKMLGFEVVNKFLLEGIMSENKIMMGWRTCVLGR